MSLLCTLNLHDYGRWSNEYHKGTDFGGEFGTAYQKYRARKCKCCGWVKEALLCDKYYYVTNPVYNPVWKGENND